MSKPSSGLSGFALLVTTIFALAALDAGAYAQKQTSGKDLNANPPEPEVGLRGQRPAREIKYGDWRKFCFKPAGTPTVCRTSISGNWENGQTAVRMDLIEREGEGSARLQLFMPVGLYLPAGVKFTIDQGSQYRLPYVWCLANACIAADLADPKVIGEMESGSKLALEVVDSNILSVTTSVPLDQFATARRGAPVQTFDQAIDQ
jgi:invasion protein IalB